MGVGVAWDDLLGTHKRRRVRVTLMDETIISLGSDSLPRMVKAQARTQQTTLELGLRTHPHADRQNPADGRFARRAHLSLKAYAGFHSPGTT